MCGSVRADLRRAGRMRSRMCRSGSGALRRSDVRGSVRPGLRADLRRPVRRSRLLRSGSFRLLRSREPLRTSRQEHVRLVQEAVQQLPRLRTQVQLLRSGSQLLRSGSDLCGSGALRRSDLRGSVRRLQLIPPIPL